MMAKVGFSFACGVYCVCLKCFKCAFACACVRVCVCVE